MSLATCAAFSCLLALFSSAVSVMDAALDAPFGMPSSGLFVSILVPFLLVALDRDAGDDATEIAGDDSTVIGGDGGRGPCVVLLPMLPLESHKSRS